MGAGVFASMDKLYAYILISSSPRVWGIRKELRDQIIEFNRAGRAVKVEGLGTYSPNISLDGTLDLQYRADTAFSNGLNIPGIFTGTVLNRENIGKTGEELVAKWNSQYPEDQATFSEN